MNEQPIYTIYSSGHSNRSIEEFLFKLKENRIDILVDVRSVPVSRWTPHFGKMMLERALESENIQYLYRGQNLGGRGDNEGYEEAIGELTELAKNDLNVCVMCSEGDYRKCHRFTTLTPSFEARGLFVTHIEYEPAPKRIAPKRATD